MKRLGVLAVVLSVALAGCGEKAKEKPKPVPAAPAPAVTDETGSGPFKPVDESKNTEETFRPVEGQ